MTVESHHTVRSRKTGWLLLIAYLGLAFVILWRSPESVSNLRPSDAIHYAAGAENLVRHGSYEIEFMGEAHPPRYPPGFSLFFLAPVYLVYKGNPGTGILSVIASSMTVFTVIWFFSRRILGDLPGISAAFLTLFCLVNLPYFYNYSRLIMSDIPALALGMIALVFYYRALDEGRPGDYFWGGIVLALAFQTRWTLLGLALPYAYELIRKSGDHRFKKGMMFALPVFLSILATLLYNWVRFDNPIYSGYQYWITESRRYELSLSFFMKNLLIFINPHILKEHAIQLNRLLGIVIILIFILVGFLCFRLRKEAWSRSIVILKFILLGACPILVFHLFYPFNNPRFILIVYTYVVFLFIIWIFSLLNTLPRTALICVIVLASAGSLITRPPDHTPHEQYFYTMCREIDEIIPEDGVLISCFNMIKVDHFLVRGTGRTHIPMFMNNRSYGKHGEPRNRIFEFNTRKSPERIAEFLRSGRSVYAVLLAPEYPNLRERLKPLLDLYETESVWKFNEVDALIELHLKEY